MNEFIVTVDRSRGQLRINGNRIFLPFQREGMLWSDLEKPLHASPTGDLTPEAQDLVDFATAIFHLDKICLRGQREQWVRKFHLKIALRNPDKFREIEAELRWALTLLGGDNFSFEVTQLNSRPRPRIRVERRVRNWGRITDIALLSGGQDSFAGAVNILNDPNARPLLVRVNTRDKANLREVTARLRQRFNRDPAFYSQTVASPVDPDESPKVRETSQRLRSFYFLAIGAVLSKAHGVNRLHINENGIMAIHLPLDPARASTFSTRTAYPQFLHLFQSIVQRWLDCRVEVKNAFALMTKTEVLDACNRLGMASSLGQTVSCAHSATIQQTVRIQASREYLMSREAPDLHCGYCFPCLLRRVSMWKAGLAAYDVTYATDPFKVFVDGSSDDYDFVYEATSAVLGLLRLTRKFENPDLLEMLAEYPQIAECAAVLGAGSMNGILDLHRRFSVDVRDYVRANAPYLNFFYDPQRSRQLEQQVATIASDQILDAVLQRMNAQGSEAFYRQMHKLFDMLRLRIQVALADGSMSIQEMQTMLDDVVNSVVRSRRQPITLTQSDGVEIRDTTMQAVRRRRCPPFF